MQRKKSNRERESPKYARKAYKECVRVRRLIRSSIAMNLREILRITTDIDRGIAIIATELRRQQLDDRES